MSMTNNGNFETVRRNVEEQCFLADDGANEREYELVDSLYNVADLICRIADHRDDCLCRGKDAGRLVTAALDARCVALQNYGGTRDDQRAELDGAMRLEKELDDEINRVMWGIARRHDGSATQLSCSDATALLRALQRLVDWAEKVAATAVADSADQ